MAGAEYGVFRRVKMGMAHLGFDRGRLCRLFLCRNGSLRNLLGILICPYGAVHDASLLSHPRSTSRSTLQKSLHQRAVGVSLFVLAGSLFAVQRFAPPSPQELILTDPYDDPESNFMDPDLWQSVPESMKRVFRLNNTLLGRMVI